MLKKLIERAKHHMRYRAPKNIDLVHRIVDATDPILPGRLVIETLSYCNGTCTFCPSNKLVDTRGNNVMSEAVLERILLGLSAWKYNGIIAMHGNSEPLLNPDIAEIVRRVRKAAPDAAITLWTNGTKLDWSKHEQLFANGLNHMHINNYSQKGKIHNSVGTFMEQFNHSRFANHPDVLVEVFMRKLDEVLYNKGGQAPNNRAGVDFVALTANCGDPIRNMQINYNGDAFSCCFDDYYSTTFGNVMTSTLDDIWRSSAYRQFRRDLVNGERRNYPACAKCDIPHEGECSWFVKDTAGGREVHASPALFSDTSLNKKFAAGSHLVDI